ncbi:MULTISPECIES: TIGR02530 family flagellar biosynthesis protein [Tepidanaerobacter]|uniref:TIGR02530 family flagellar biosynthesis protein n=1 Tax=Tepidanaerobacter TaxID=499228 RepID=UPI000B2FA115|nr:MULTISPECIES: TIGR02530 family flagellar biosynthesis protein [Tepidanaerobacter]
MDDYLKIQQRINDVQIFPASESTKKQDAVAKNGTFGDILKQKVEENELKISQHAQMRMNMRNINLTEEQKKMLSNAVDRASQKGVKESLVLMQDMAFVVSVKNRTVITAMNGESIKENVFTNIDGAVIL